MAATAQRQQQAAEVDEESTCKDLDVIAKHGITQTDIKKFKEAGYYTVESVMQTANKFLLAIKGITEKKLEDIKKACSKEYNTGFRKVPNPSLTESFTTILNRQDHPDIVCMPGRTGTEQLQLRKTVKKITTGCKELDKILGGGLESMSITEIYGEYRTGKTQWVHTMVVTSMLPSEAGGGAGKVVVLDTEGTFRPEKIKPIADRFGVDADTVLENLITARPFNTDHQFDLIKNLSGIMVSDGPFSLLIIDSITSLLRVDFVGRGELSMRQQLLGQMLSNITKLAAQFNIAVLLTNQVMSNPDGGMTFVSDPKKPVGGHVLAHASTTRIELKKGRGDCRVAKIVDSPSMPEAEATFQLSEKGIIDPEG